MDVPNGNFFLSCPLAYCNKSLLETLNPYNRPGSLIVRSDGKLQVLDKHKVRRRGEVNLGAIGFPLAYSFLVNRTARASQILYNKRREI